MRHHTLVHKVDLKFIERAKAKRESERVPDVERDPAQVSLEGEDLSPRQAVERYEGYRQSAYVALVEVLPIVVFGEKGKQEVMASRDSGCNTTLMDESLALSLGLQGKDVDLEIQGVNVRKVFTSQHIKRCRVARVGREEAQYSLQDVKKIPHLSNSSSKSIST